MGIGLDLSLDGRTVIMGIGNEDRGDDATGIRIVEKLKNCVDSPHILVINTGLVPENYTSVVKDFEPDNVILIDSVDFGGNAGTISVVDPSTIQDDYFSTHRIPLSRLINYLEDETGAQVKLIGIQSKQAKLNADLSKEVEDSIEKLVEILSKKLS